MESRYKDMVTREDVRSQQIWFEVFMRCLRPSTSFDQKLVDEFTVSKITKVDMV